MTYTWCSKCKEWHSPSAMAHITEAARDQMEADCRIIENAIREYEEFRQRGTAFKADVALRAVKHSIRKAADVRDRSWRRDRVMTPCHLHRLAYGNGGTMNAMTKDEARAVIAETAKIIGEAVRWGEAQVRADEAERCCRDVCHLCWQGYPVKWTSDGRCYHDVSQSVAYGGCAAQAIRERMVREKQS